MDPERTAFALRVERVRLQAMVAAARLTGSPLEPEAAARLATVERVAAGLDGPGAEADRRMTTLATALGLDADTVELVWSAVAAAVEPRLDPFLQALGARTGLTLSTHAAVAGLDGDTARHLGLTITGEHPLVTSGLIEVGEAGGAGARTVTVSRRLARHLAGDDQVDDDVAAAGGVVEVPEQMIVTAAQAAALERMAVALSGAGLFVLIEGPRGGGRRTAAARAAAGAGRALCAIDLGRLPPTRAALERAVRALRRECTLRGAVPLIAGLDDLRAGEHGDDERARVVARAIDAVDGPVFCTTADAGVELPYRRRLLRIRWPEPDIDARRRLWSRALAGDAEALAAEVPAVAGRFRLGPGGIARAVDAARLVARARGQGAALVPADLATGVRNDVIERLGSLAMRVEVHQSWDDLVLSADTLDQIKALTSRVRHAHKVLDDWGLAAKVGRATGVAALFSGPPGTGKTMVAGLIARELDLDLYQVDLSKVVSKWVGETEKQLSRIFDAAGTGHALLLFDEADALFARRTEVKSSVDRYANLEVNYLLQRIEAQSGITILTTNLDASIDPALRRRLAGHVVFWPPDEGERTELWRRMLAARAPLADDLDLEELAVRFPDMTGANIRNAALGAAFLAAAEEQAIDQSLLERAARAEYISMGRVLGQRRG